MAEKPSRKTHWGWIAFGIGLAACVIAGGVLGAVLGERDSHEEGDNLQRIAALALDTSRLNDDALALSHAIEETIAQDTLETEGEALRADLRRLEEQAQVIQVRADSQRGAYGAAAPAAVEPDVVARKARQGLRQIDATLAVFEQEVVASLGTALSSPPPEASTAGTAESPAQAALADARVVLEGERQAMDDLANDLTQAPTESDISGDRVDEEEAALVSGSFESPLEQPGYMLEIDYELRELDAEAAMASVTALASGELTLTNAGPSLGLELPTVHLVLYWEWAKVPSPAVEATTSEGVAPCRYERDGERYCELARLVFGEIEPSPGAAGGAIPEPGEVALEPNATAGADSLEAETSLLVEKENDANLIAEFIASSPPDLVQVLGESYEGDLLPACSAPDTSEEGEYGEAEYGDAILSTLGLLSADGKVVLEAAAPDRSPGPDTSGPPELPDCFTPPGE